MKIYSLRIELQKRMDQKQLELRDLEKQIAAGLAYIEAMQEALSLLEAEQVA